MSNNKKNIIAYNSKETDYNRLCTGLLAGYAGNLLALFKDLKKIEEEQHIGNDQILLNVYYLKYPASIRLDYRCELFQNLWRTSGGLYGKILPEDKNCEIEVFEEGNGPRIRNKYFNTMPLFLHAPFNLDMSSVLSKLHLDPPPLDYKRGWYYWKYSILFYIKLGIRFYLKELVFLFLLLLALLLIIISFSG